MDRYTTGRYWKLLCFVTFVLLTACSDASRSIDGALFALLQPTSGELPDEIPEREPVLNALNVTTRLDAEQEYQFIEVSYSFAAAPPEGTTIRAYLGRPGYMALKTDGSVSGFIKEEFDFIESGEFLFLSPELWASYRVIVVARSPSGFSAAQALSNPPPPPPSPCSGAVAAPATIGDCAIQCIQVTLNGAMMELTASYMSPVAMDYVYVDLSTSTAGGAGGPTATSYREEFAGTPGDLPAGLYSPPMSSFNVNDFNDACVAVSSFYTVDAAGSFDMGYITGKIIVP